MPSLILSFDTEDFVTPQSDDALLRLATELSRRGIRGCFALVGDKLRALLARGRGDVIEALRSHEIDYHSNDHHFFPLQAPLLEGQAWEDSLAWMLEHEATGVELIEQVFGVRPRAYVKADSHWTVQALVAYQRLGLDVYSSRHFATGDPHPWRYLNLLSVPYSGMLDSFIAMPGTAKKLLAAALEEVGGRLSGEAPVVYGTHPCMWSCPVFYDVHNVKRRGHPPAREKWTPAPLLPEERVRRNYRFLSLFLDALLAEGVRFTTYEELAAQRARPPEWLTAKQVTTLARHAAQVFGVAAVDGKTYSAAEQLGVLCHALAQADAGGLPGRVPVLTPLGPVQTPRRLAEPLPVCARALQGACQKLDQAVRQTGIIPAGVDVGGHHFPPGELLRAAAEGVLRVADGQKPACTPLRPGPDCPQEAELLKGARIGAWSLPAGYHPEGLLELGRLQSWTLKPA